MRALAATGLATASTVNFVSVMTGGPVERPPARLPVRFCDADIFQLFNIDFRYGGPFTAPAPTSPAPRRRARPPEVVLSDMLNQQLYGGADSVGRMIRIAGRDFRVVGVMRQRPGKMNLWDFGVAPENIANLLVPFAFADELRPVPVYLVAAGPARRSAGAASPTRRAASPSTGSACRRARRGRASPPRWPAIDPQLVAALCRRDRRGVSRSRPHPTACS